MTQNKHNAKNLSLQLAKELHGHLENALGSQVQVTLFGSQARGEATDEADIDMLVVLPDLEKGTLDIVLEVAWEIGFEAGKVLSVIPATPEEMGVLSASPFFRLFSEKASLFERQHPLRRMEYEPSH